MNAANLKRTGEMMSAVRRLLTAEMMGSVDSSIMPTTDENDLREARRLVRQAQTILEGVQRRQAERPR